MTKLILGFFGFLVFFGVLSEQAEAAAAAVTLRLDHHLITVRTKDARSWQAPKEEWFYNGTPIAPSPSWRVDGDGPVPLPPGITRAETLAWNTAAIAEAIRLQASPLIDREARSVTISRSASGAIVFDGVGLPGRRIDVPAAAQLVAAALKTGAKEAWMPVIETPASVTVLDEELKNKGIKEVVTVGESDFSNSPTNRIHNIGVGLRRFNAHRIPQGSTFSFLDVLGPVDGTTGYKKELVIKGDKTVPDFGGGLCQVSTTAYRGVWEYGFPIARRQNHSFSVSHYMPVGTDATVFTSGPDVQFLNDSPGDLLMQTYAEGHFAYFVYYGTKDSRDTEIIGPFTWDHRPAPPQRLEYTTDLEPGVRRKVGDAVPGLKAMWFRIVARDGKESVEPVFSSYAARPLFYQVGVAAGTGSGELSVPEAVDTAG